MDSRELRFALGRFPTGVAVVTCWLSQGQRHGLTVNSFTSVSLEPPLVLVSVSRRAKGLQYLEENSFTVNVLRAHQVELALHFAGHPRAGVEPAWEDRPLAPRLKGALAAIDCRPWRTYDGGDHVLYVGEVDDFSYHGGDALVFFCGQFARLGLSAAVEQVSMPWGDECGIDECQAETGWFGGQPSDVPVAVLPDWLGLSRVRGR